MKDENESLVNLKITNRLESGILFIIFWNYTVFQYSGDLSQIKTILISSIKKLLFDFSNELQTWKNEKSLNFGRRKSLYLVLLPEINLWQWHSKSRQKHFQVFYNFTGFLQFVQNILSGIFWANNILVIVWTQSPKKVRFFRQFLSYKVTL